MIPLPLQRRFIQVKTRDGFIHDFPISKNGNVFTASLGIFGNYREECRPEEDGCMSGRVEIRVNSDDDFIVRVPFILEKGQERPWFMIPGFLYGSNNLEGSDGPQPRLRYGAAPGWPESGAFLIRADRSSHPSVITHAGGFASLVGISECLLDEQDSAIALTQGDEWDPAWLYNGLLLDTSGAEADWLGFQLGYENAPARYSWREEDRVPGRDEKCAGWISGMKGRTLHAGTFYAVVESKRIPDYGKLLEGYYRHIHQLPLKRSTRRETMEKISHSILRHSWMPEAKGFALVDDGALEADIAWTGGMQVAWPLLRAAHKTGNTEARQVALTYIQNLCHTAMNEEAGLLHEEFRNGRWEVTGWWGIREDCFNWGDTPLHSAYLNGQASYYLLKAYELEDRQNSRWLNTARRVLDTAVRGQRKDGALPVFFDPADGNAVDYEGFQPCWFVPALVLLHKFTGEPSYLEAAEKALLHYHGHHLKGELFNTPMDTHRAVDQEGNLAFIVACVEMHKLKGEQKYLDMGIDGLSWEFSWKFAYNSRYSNEPLRSIKWSTCGGSITSTHNPSIHQMGNLVAGEIYYLYRQTGSEYIAARLRDTCIWGLGTYNLHDGDFGFGLEGQATEQFTYTDAIVLPWPGPWDGGVWAASLSWASACVLLSCAEDIPDEFFEP